MYKISHSPQYIAISFVHVGFDITSQNSCFFLFVICAHFVHRGIYMQLAFVRYMYDIKIQNIGLFASKIGYTVPLFS